jgi:hypothetical protein
LLFTKAIQHPALAGTIFIVGSKQRFFRVQMTMSREADKKTTKQTLDTRQTGFSD